MPLPEWAKPITTGAPTPSKIPSWAQPIQAAPQVPAIEQPQAQEPSFIERVGQDWSGRSEEIGQMLKRQTAGGVLPTIARLPEIGFLTAGKLAGGVGDVAAEGLKGAYETLMPESAQEAISGGFEKIAQTDIGKMGLQALQAGAGAYGQFKQAYPESAMALESAINIGTVGAGGLGAQQAGKRALTPSPESLAKKFTANVERGIQKSIRPGVEGKRTFGQAQRYYTKAKDAISSIIDNKDSLRLTDEFGDVVQGTLPKNLKQFSQAIEQTKKNIYGKYNQLAVTTGKAGGKVELNPIAQELSKITASKPLADNAPDVVRYASERMDALAKRGAYSTEEAQEAITILNNSLESFYKNPSYDTASKAYVDSLIVNNMRKNLDDVIEKATGAEYQALKNEYGALKTIERDVNRRAIVDARKNTKGLVDFTDVLSGDKAVVGIMTMNPVAVGEAAAMKTISGLLKMANDPNRIVKNMFLQAEKTKAQMVPGILTAPQKAATNISKIDKIVQDVKKIVSPDKPAYMRTGRTIDLSERSVLPPRPIGPAEKSASVFSEMFELAKTPEGKRLLVERLSKEEKYSKILEDVLNVPTTMALPMPERGFTMVSPEESSAALSKQIVSKRLGEKKLIDETVGQLGRTERVRLNALRRGLFPGNR